MFVLRIADHSSRFSCIIRKFLIRLNFLAMFIWSFARCPKKVLFHTLVIPKLHLQSPVRRNLCTWKVRLFGIAYAYVWDSKVWKTEVHYKCENLNYVIYVPLWHKHGIIQSIYECCITVSGKYENKYVRVKVSWYEQDQLARNNTKLA